MKIKVLQENLLKALVRVGRNISSKTQLPVLQNVLLQTENNLLRVTTTNLETTVSMIVPAKVLEEGSVCVSSKLFTELVTTLSQETVDLAAKDEGMDVQTPKTRATLPVTAPGEFPPVKLIDGKAKEHIDTKVMKSALDAVLFAAATDEGRPLLTGIKIRSEEDSLLFVATDGYRLSLKRVPHQAAAPMDLVVPARALSEVNKVLSEEKEEESVRVQKLSEGQLGVHIGDTQIITRLIDGEYPAFAKIIPKTHGTSVTIDAEELSRAVRSVSIFARDSANIVRLTISADGMKASANTPQVGKNEVDIEAETDGDGGEIAFNSRFLTDFLNNFSGERVVFEMTGSLNSGVFKIPDDDSFLHIIMPVRVQS